MLLVVLPRFLEAVRSCDGVTVFDELVTASLQQFVS